MNIHTKQVSFRLPSAMIAELDAIKTRDGIPVSEQIRRAVQWWIEERGDAPAPVRRSRRATTGARA